MVYFHMLNEKEKHLCMIDDDIIFSNKEQIILTEILIEKKISYETL